MKSHYRIVGTHLHSAIKPCHWLEQRLLTGRENRNCYKGYFGVKSHLCLQNTPALPFCNQSCVFCWRDIENGTLGTDFLATPDEPKEIIEGMLRHQRDILDHHLTVERAIENLTVMQAVGALMRDGNPRSLAEIAQNTKYSTRQVAKAVKVLKNSQVLRAMEDLKHVTLHSMGATLLQQGLSMDGIIEKNVTTEREIRQAHAEAHNPTHAAISLGGEPILYPHISEFVAEFRRRRFTTFIVTNGTRPDLIRNLTTLPSQIYVSMPVPTPEDYAKICRPAESRQWDQYLETLDLLPSLSCRTCIRITAIRDLNMVKPELYAKLIQRGKPNFIDVKAFTLEASALRINKRMKLTASGAAYVPSFLELKKFALDLCLAGSFSMVEEVKRSRDILLTCNWPEKKPLIIKQP